MNKSIPKIRRDLLFQIHYAEEEYEKSIFYIDRYQALQPALDPELDLMKTEAMSLLSSL